MSEFLVGERMIIISRGKRRLAESRKRSGFWPVLWVIVALLVLMGVDANIRSLTTYYKYRVTDVNMDLERLAERENELSANIETLRNPRRIEKIALKKLGLREPDSERVYRER